jgi:hypothetical protein
MRASPWELSFNASWIVLKLPRSTVYTRQNKVDTMRLFGNNPRVGRGQGKTYLSVCVPPAFVRHLQIWEKEGQRQHWVDLDLSSMPFGRRKMRRRIVGRRIHLRKKWSQSNLSLLLKLLWFWWRFVMKMGQCVLHWWRVLIL